MAALHFPAHRKRWIQVLSSVILFLGSILLLLHGFSKLSNDTTARQKQVLEDAIHRDLSYCYILEGRYPADLPYLKEHYGLQYDESRFFVDYQPRGGNLLPDVTILERRP